MCMLQQVEHFEGRFIAKIFIRVVHTYVKGRF